MIATPCVGCEFPVACGEVCEADRIDQEEIPRIVAEQSALHPQQAGHGEAEGALRPFSEDEGGRLYQGDVTATVARLTDAAIAESVVAQEQGALW